MEDNLMYVVKHINLKVLGIIIAHVVNDDCTEFTAILRKEWILNDYYKYTDLNIINLTPYDSDYWHKIRIESEYSMEVEYYGF